MLARSTGGVRALAMVLRREEQGPVLAVELVTDRDLADARAELWFEAFLRRGHLDVPLEDVHARPRPIHRDTTQRDTTHRDTTQRDTTQRDTTQRDTAQRDTAQRDTARGARACVGFSLTAEAPSGGSGQQVQCVFTRGALEPVAA
ncbi:MAG: hypothetical protein V3T22_01010, partial [Planctomycetota bacterium]